jgi:hypothetical protein
MARNGSSPAKQERRVRVRARPLAQIDEAKLAVALSIMARRLIEEAAQTAPAGRREVA